MRGNLFSILPVSLRLGSIPASAGQPVGLKVGTRTLRVYPRECGATLANIDWYSCPTGLSPRVRGNLGDRPPPGCLLRSIPASAGQPRTLQSTATVTQVYPRECGATSKPAKRQSFPTGLSPRVRGNHQEAVSRCRKPGSIPASAGQPSWCNLSTPHPAVYPRECGATRRYLVNTSRVCGLSPRVRGNRC